MSTPPTAPVSPIFCGSCGTPAQPGEAFCGSCGQSLSGASVGQGTGPTLPTPLPVPPRPVNSNVAPQARKRSSTGLVIFIVGAVVMVPIIFAVGVGLLFLRSARIVSTSSTNAASKSSTPQPTSTPRQAATPSPRSGIILDGKTFTYTRRGNASSSTSSSHSITTTRKPSTPPLSARRVTESDLAGKSQMQLDILRNEIYARHGYIFARRDLAEYFRRQPWYRPRTRSENAVWQQLSPIEQYNTEFIRNYQRRF